MRKLDAIERDIKRMEHLITTTFDPIEYMRFAVILGELETELVAAQVVTRLPDTTPIDPLTHAQTIENISTVK